MLNLGAKVLLSQMAKFSVMVIQPEFQRVGTLPEIQGVGKCMMPEILGEGKGILPDIQGEISLACDPFLYRVLNDSTASIVSATFVKFPDIGYRPFDASITSSEISVIFGFEADEITTSLTEVLGLLNLPLPSANLYTVVRTGAKLCPDGYERYILYDLNFFARKALPGFKAERQLSPRQVFDCDWIRSFITKFLSTIKKGDSVAARGEIIRFFKDFFLTSMRVLSSNLEICLSIKYAGDGAGVLFSIFSIESLLFSK